MFIRSRVLSKKLDRKLPKSGEKKDPLSVFLILNTDLSSNTLTFISEPLLENLLTVKRRQKKLISTIHHFSINHTHTQKKKK